jgi:homoserine kinase
MRVRIAVPATVANLGPGFDIFALALQLQDDINAVSNEEGRISIDPGADSPEQLKDPEYNLVTRAYAKAAADMRTTPHGASFTVVARIPVARGFGSSAAATLAGVLAAVALHQAPWDEQHVIECAARFEGHRDNVAAALLGGLAIAAPGAPARSMLVPEELRAVLFIPDIELRTAVSREVVPSQFPRDDAIFNAARCALFVRAIALEDYASLNDAMEDRWHQTARSALLPAAHVIMEAARAAGASGAALAGAGPSVIALTRSDGDAIAAAMHAAAVAANVSGRTMTLPVRNYGARIDVGS